MTTQISIAIFITIIMLNISLVVFLTVRAAFKDCKYDGSNL